MKRAVTYAVVACMAAGSLAARQGTDAGAVLAAARAVLGGDRLAAVKTLTAAGRTLRTMPDGNTRESEFEMSLALPDKYLLRTAMMAMGNMSIYRNTGFNGGQAIEEIDRPPNLSGANIVIRVAGPGGSPTDPGKMTPEQKAEADRQRLLANHREFARLALGMFASSFDAYPLEFSYGGQAESPDGKADVIDVRGEGEFAVKLFVDSQTHLPLMLSWMDKEPIVIQMGGPGGSTVAAGGGGMRIVERRGEPMSKEDMEKMEKDLAEKRKEAEAKRRTVEFRLYYSDYAKVDGVMLPHRIQRSIDGKPTEEMVFESIKVNPKIDAKTFQVSK